MTRGRGITENTIEWFVDILDRCIPIYNYLETFADVFSSLSEQHKDLRSSCLDRELKDLESFID